MLRKKNFSFFLYLIVLTAVFVLSGCSSQGAQTGSGNIPAGKPDTVRITIDKPTPPQATPTVPVVTLTDSEKVQQLYKKVYALPLMPEQQVCTMELGPHYTLTFIQGGKTLVTALAKREGCHPVSISGEAHDRQAGQDFWNMLDQIVGR